MKGFVVIFTLNEGPGRDWLAGGTSHGNSIFSSPGSGGGWRESREELPLVLITASR
jgi:hypothetical protein